MSFLVSMCKQEPPDLIPHPALANALGYVSEISKGKLERDETGIYKQGDYIGQSGIESFYEEQLRGKRGVKFKLRNVRGIEKGSLSKMVITIHFLFRVKIW